MSASSTFLQLASAEYLQDHLPTLPSPACVAKFVFSLAVAPVVSTLRSLIITSAWDQVEIKLPRVRGRTPCRQLWWFNKIESRVSCYAKPAKNPTDKDPAGREKVCSPLAFSLYTSVELKFLLPTRLTRQTHAGRNVQPVEKSIASLVLRVS